MRIIRFLFSTCSTFITICLVIILSMLPEAHGGHFPIPEPGDTRFFCDYIGRLRINGEDAMPGDEVAFLDHNGAVCGVYSLDKNLLYGFVHVYGDDPATPEDEGASAGEKLCVIVWDASAGREYAGQSVLLTPGDPAGSSVASDMPPVWIDGAIFVLNIDAVLPGDFNSDGTIDMSDALLSLKIVSGYEYQSETLNIADIDGDHRIGLEETVYVLRKIAELQKK